MFKAQFEVAVANPQKTIREYELELVESISHLFTISAEAGASGTMVCTIAVLDADVEKLMAWLNYVPADKAEQRTKASRKAAFKRDYEKLTVEEEVAELESILEDGLNEMALENGNLRVTPDMRTEMARNILVSPPVGFSREALDLFEKRNS